MVWIVVFAVKFAFLSYFRHLVIAYWKVVAGINVVAFLFCVCAEFMECPSTSLKTCESVPAMCTKRGLYPLCVLVTCGQGSGFYRAAGFSRAAIGLDVITDLLSPGHQSSSNAKSLIANSHQYPDNSSLAGENQTPPEIGIGAFLCLSIFMIVIACIRISGYKVYGSDGYTWQAFWMECAACVAVIMVSFTAFRSVFVAKTSKARPWWRKASKAGHDLEDLLAVPPVTFDGYADVYWETSALLGG